ncbi:MULTISPECIES: hypothetical protein [Pseudomonas syringae group]|uniref:Uncharacterized protein n=2 Tax=Pseudomonas syringae group TaxID=136849 RepID=A0A3M2WY83_PSEA0|nr:MULTISPECIES: hypothetical protein [Pseudomonas syringae group]EGH14357.1 hypothetical protein PSYMP_27488 [Pseudomonas amygdali pv. morsprunorum str. M302280]RML56520.1 hypothetical protein ALQ94_02255 [Pseudomonas amygdali pv. morsprunorum]SOS33761.1 hypothetical protein CFBP6411_02404 [Pseudomonas syringae group genomosp. 3]SPF18069.1 hypothetical protein PSCFBP3800_02593 [Pseudomonas syringae group genomosp. 3]
MKRLKFVFDVGSTSSLQMLVLVEEVLNVFSSRPVFSLQGVEVDFKTLEKKILKKKSWPSGLMSNGFKLRFGLLPALDQCFLVMEEAEWHNNTELEEEIRPILEVEGFIQAWISDVEYDFWQNATDPLEYEGVGRSLQGLPMRSNGLPPPLDQMEIDTSGNPGRNVLRQGYVEAIGSTMWLGDLFWERVGADRLSKISLLESHGFKFHELGKILKVITSKNIFFDNSTLEKQRALRKILFDVS